MVPGTQLCSAVDSQGHAANYSLIDHFVVFNNAHIFLATTDCHRGTTSAVRVRLTKLEAKRDGGFPKVCAKQLYAYILGSWFVLCFWLSCAQTKAFAETTNH